MARETFLRDGEKYISELGAEREFGFPRELLASWSGAEPVRPNDKKDLAVRRRVLLTYYAGLLKLSLREQNARKFSKRLIKDFITMASVATDRVSKATVERLQTLAIWATFADVPYEQDGTVAFEPLYQCAHQDFLAGSPSQMEIEDEYRRYLEG